jgi:hypothetical protein
MSFLPWLSRIAIVIATATLASCTYVESLYATHVAPVFEDDYPIEKVNDAYYARDSCLKWTVAMTDDGATDSVEMGARVARSCGEEIAALVLATDPHGDPLIADNINADSVLRATGYVIRSRNAVRETALKR